ncbi:MAG: peptidyl-prolyl cis-trans isomerase [marine bacterium B5-7]|nr:MAG: peptidyl-prolyl cis-trans isomerase [marine bacterium B5-7]
MMNGIISHGARLTIHYELKLPGGEVFESTFAGEPESFTVGSGEFHNPIEDRIIAMLPGDTLDFIIGANENAFGIHDPDKTHSLPTSSFEDVPCNTGSLVEFEIAGGERVSGRIECVEGDNVVVDFNHPLIGHDVCCTIQLLNISSD